MSKLARRTVLKRGVPANALYNRSGSLVLTNKTGSLILTKKVS
jgi:hypothetical protein